MRFRFIALTAGLVLAAVAVAPSFAAAELLWEPQQPTPTTLFVHGGSGATLSHGYLSISPPEGEATDRPPLPWPSACGAFPQTALELDLVGGVTYEGGAARTTAYGLQYNLSLDASAPVELVWYLAADRDASGTLAAPAPRITVEAKLVEDEGRAPPYREPLVAATGQSEPRELGAGTEGHRVVDGRDVYAFRIPLNLERDILEGLEGGGGPSWQLAVTARAAAPCPEGAAWPTVYSYTGPGARPHLNLTVLNPLRWEALQPEFRGDDLIIHAMAASPWGVGAFDGPWMDAYTVGSGSGATINLTGPSGQPSWEARFYARDDHRPDLHVHSPPVAHVDWVWNLSREPPRAGQHTIDVTFTGAGARLAGSVPVDPAGGTGEACLRSLDDANCYAVHAAGDLRRASFVPIAALPAVLALTVLVRRLRGQ